MKTRRHATFNILGVAGGVKDVHFEVSDEHHKVQGKCNTIHGPVKAGDMNYVGCPAQLRTRYVRIFMRGPKKALALIEVEVYGLKGKRVI